MNSLLVNGGNKLHGEILPSANKNAVLPVLCATLLTEDKVVLRNVPDITDVERILQFFEECGSTIDWKRNERVLEIDHSTIARSAQVTMGRAMRASIMMIPGLLVRLGEVRLEEQVKGCTLGAREIDPHVEVFRSFGIEVSVVDNAIAFKRGSHYQAASTWLEYASVTTTENFILCALTAKGTSRIVNAACEPHVQEMCEFLVAMGATITGKGTSSISVEGGSELGGTDFTFAEDYHEIATFLALSAITKGKISVQNSQPHQFPLLDRTFAKFGAEVTHRDGWSTVEVPDGLTVQRGFTPHLITKVEAAPWPYVPADLLPIFIALGVVSEGQTMFWNKVYEGGLTWHNELALFGAHTLLCDPHRLITFGGNRLVPAKVTSPYIIRVAISLLMVASAIEGESIILDADPIRRAHPNFVENFVSMGAEVQWIEQS